MDASRLGGRITAIPASARQCAGSARTGSRFTRSQTTPNGVLDRHGLPDLAWLSTRRWRNPGNPGRSAVSVPPATRCEV